ncbi:MAG: hypothetical protein R3E73_10975 [Porticoccaceae bacterium]|nr:hypothetical protein [Pseudomonadales bacterium]MCP5171159.1 hypothetical protein [Pseudomonadales bacterium]MCP5301603.1 hypothetical protein [Pseudomonadales bacterium]
MLQSNNDPLFKRTLVICGWSGLLAVIFFVIGGSVLGGMIPPLFSADESALEFVRKATENLFQIRVGTVFMIIALTFLGPMGAGIFLQTRRFERTAGLSYVQLMMAGLGTIIAILVGFSWAMMVYRVDAAHAINVQMFADLAYFLALFSAPVFCSWCVAIALPILFAEEGREPFPRWVAYLNIWAAVLYVPGQLILFFKDGLFAWHGIVAMWIPYIAFFLWILISSLTLLQAAKKVQPE